MNGKLHGKGCYCITCYEARKQAVVRKQCGIATGLILNAKFCNICGITTWHMRGDVCISCKPESLAWLVARRATQQSPTEE